MQKPNTLRKIDTLRVDALQPNDRNGKYFLDDLLRDRIELFAIELGSSGVMPIDLLLPDALKCTPDGPNRGLQRSMMENLGDEFAHRLVHDGLCGRNGCFPQVLRLLQNLAQFVAVYHRKSVKPLYARHDISRHGDIEK